MNSSQANSKYPQVVTMTNKKWCDICEKEVKRKTIKINKIGYSIYVCDKHNTVKYKQGREDVE